MSQRWENAFECERVLTEALGWYVKGKVWSDGYVSVAMPPDNTDSRGFTIVSVKYDDDQLIRWQVLVKDDRAICALERARAYACLKPELPALLAGWLTILIEGYYAQYPEERPKLN